jgi:Synergist-CTERM protein sorting domain-containing protein
VLSVVFLLCGAAAADVVYAVSDYATGEIGIIDSNLEAKPLGISTTGDPVIFSFSEEKESRVMVVERDSLGGNGGDAVIVYEDGMAPIENQKWEGCSNIHGIAPSDDKFYAAFFGNLAGGKPGPVAAISFSDYKTVQDKYEHPITDGYSAYPEKVLIVDGHVYALFSLAKEGASAYEFEYDKSKLVKLDMNLQPIQTYDVGKNAVDMTLWGGKIAVAYWGGNQEPGASGGVDVFDPATGEVEPLTTEDGGVTALCVADNDILYFITQEQDSSFKTSSKLYKWASPSKGKTLVHDISSDVWTFPAVAYDAVAGNIVATAGDTIWIFDKDGLKKSFNNQSLGGKAYSLAVVAKASAPGSSNDGGGCSTGLTAFSALLLVLPLALRKKSR